MQTSTHGAGAAYTPFPPDPFADLRQELMAWAEPVVADRILEAYEPYGLSPERTRRLAGQHRRLWRAILLGMRSVIELLETELQSGLAAADLDPDIAEAIDHLVLEELIDIVLKRYRASGERMKGFSMILLGAASHMGPQRVALAS